MSVPSQNNHSQVLWRLLVEERVPYILYVWYVRFCTSILWIMRELAEEGMSLLALNVHFNGTSKALQLRLTGTSTELQWHFNGTKKPFLCLAGVDNFLMVFYKLN